MAKTGAGVDAAVVAKATAVDPPGAALPANPEESGKAVSVPLRPDAEASSAANRAETSSTEFVLSAGMAPSQSWLARNKYIVMALVIGGGVAALLLLR